MPQPNTTLQAKEQVLPSAESTRTRLRAYMETLDVSAPQIAKMLDRGTSTIEQFLRGAYTTATTKPRRDVDLRAHIEDWLNRHPVGLAQDAGSGMVYDTLNARQLREAFAECYERGSMIAAYGPPGSQKTFVAEQEVAAFNRRELARKDSRDRAYMVRCTVKMGPRDLFARICRAVGIPAGQSLERCITGLQMLLRERNIVLVVDECQRAHIDALDALRDLHDDNVGILLLGSHTFARVLDARAAELEQLNSRIDHRFALQGLTAAEARGIVAAELPKLPREAADAMIDDSRADDAYSRERQKYYSIRRLSKAIADFRRLAAAEVVTPQEVLQ